MLQSVTSVHKGLSPSRLITIFNIVKGCPYWAHTMYIKHLADSANFKVVTLNLIYSGLTGLLSEMPNEFIY
jgi:hypothetical protein